jgi:hypothetical protein
MLITERKFGIFNIVNIYFAREYMSENIPVSDVITFHTYKNWGKIPGFEKRRLLTQTIDLSQSKDSIWEDLHRVRKRQILRAQKCGIKVIMSAKYEEYNQLYKKFLKRKCYGDPSKFDILSSKFMQEYGVLFISEYQGEMLGGYLYIHDQDTTVAIVVAYQDFDNSFERKRLISDANSYIQWEAMQYFKNLGLVTYDFGGLSGDGTNINQKTHGGNFYKRSFGGKLFSQYQYTKFNSNFYKLLFNSWIFLQIRKTRGATNL